VARLTLIAINIAAIVVVCIPFYRIDLDVYRIGSQVWLHGGNLYGQEFRTAQGPFLPFTYPPFSAVLFSPMSMIPMKVAAEVLTAVTVGTLVLVLWPFLDSLGWKLGWVLPAALLLEPVRSTFGYGQVNILLMGLVVADCLVGSPRWPRGLLTGLAAAIKLTPAMFVLFFLVRRDYRAACVSALTFGAAAGLGYLLAPADSLRYWTHSLWNVDRIGGLFYTSNQSIVGVLARAGLRPETVLATVTWLTLSVLVIALALYGMHKAIAAGAVALALMLNAFGALLVSPVSWSHHWVWVEPALLAIVGCARSGWRLMTIWGCVVFASAPHWWLPQGGSRELHWAVWQQVIGSSYAIFGAAVLMWAAVVFSARRADTDAEPTAELTLSASS
jgi:alpha-1,2-mannosyltransferase